MRLLFYACALSTLLLLALLLPPACARTGAGTEALSPARHASNLRR